MTFDVDRLRREEFPAATTGEAIYLNTASTGPLPRRSVDAVARFNELRATPNRISQQVQFGTLDRSRELVGRLIGASPGEIGLAVNTGFGINVAATSLPLGPGDVVLGFEGEFPANVYPWMAAARTRGFELRMLPAPVDESANESLIRRLDDPAVKAVALSWVGFASGFRFDLAAIGAACRERGITLVVDAIQGLGPCTIDVGRTPVDILACGCQKWLLSPWGTAFVYVRQELLEGLAPAFPSWMSVRGSDDFSRLVDYDMTWREDARRFESITLPFQDFAGMNASLELMLEIGLQRIEAHSLELATRIVDWARDHGIPATTPSAPGSRAAIVGLRVPGAAARSAALTRAGVSHSLREGAIRLAPYFFNTTADVDQALALVDGR